ncbi:carboxymuconolactone decarboxylase [Polymorphobacter glacialis]|uniref:Carboxymuconolactone decarboxylase n=1 Tax=Sandarakinorhabdus glacialis TaxID=1614636 RepID=A0A917E2T8_9SPHN|nr:carboxymuconolactone decarboxylase family protein [Polymorphobacter glacialis]GGD99543.1 carboxymuconolactone decarboxylase [Polymorphobacter glacialis]
MDMPHRIDSPRIAPLEPSEWAPKLHEQLLGNRPAEMGGAAAPVFNIFKTLANHPRLAGQFGRWGNQILFRSSLSARDRELAILRVGWLCRATYEWHHHVAIARDHAGMSEADIELARVGPTDGGSADDVLLRAVDELVGDHFVSAATWALLAERYQQVQLIDLVFVVGQYVMVSMALNSFGVQLEPEYR